MSEQTIPAPGPERDALVAERVFGWTYASATFPSGELGWWVRPRGIGQVDPANWSTDDPAALLVLAAMEGKGYGWQIQRDQQAGNVVVHFWQRFRLVGSSLDGPTLADAITAAALRALEAARRQGLLDQEDERAAEKC
jgi:hypothetical protein